MEYEEYMKSLTEQVHDKRAKRLVAEEIKNHIEEQAEAYEAEGADRKEAVQRAVRQMGNPVETGFELNKIHKPKMPWGMLGLVSCLMLAAIVMQAVIFSEGALTYDNWKELLGKALVYHAVGFAFIMLLLYMDYNFLAKYAYQFYAVFLIMLPIGMFILVHIFSLESSVAATGYYGVQMLFPIVFAGVLYQNRNRGVMGIGVCLTCGILEICWYAVVGSFLGRYAPSNYNAANAETILIILLLLGSAIGKGIFGKDKKKQCLGLLAGSGIVIAAGVVGIFCISGRGNYIWNRLLAIVTKTESSYMNVHLQEAVKKADWIGGETFVLGGVNTETYTTFALNGVFTYFGKATGVLLIGLYLVFLLLALRMSLKQCNRIGFLIGTACTLSIFVRFAAYVAINMGCGLWWTTLVPFFSYGKISAVMNGIYIGLILCVYRNSNILYEAEIPQKPWKRIRLIVE